MNLLCRSLIFLFLVMMSCENQKVSIVKNPDVNIKNSNYVSNRAPLQPAPLIKLPLGSVMANGWLQHQLELTVNGAAGHLDELSYFLQDSNGWLNPDGIGWEEQPYWLRGFLPLAFLTQDSSALNKVDKWINAVLAGQDDDGFFGPQNLRSVPGKQGQHLCDLWPHMVMIDVLRQYFKVTGDERIIPFLTRFFEFCLKIPDEEFINIESLVDPSRFPESWKAWNQNVVWKNKMQHIRAGDMVPHLIWLYNYTGEAWLLDLAERFYQKIRPSEGQWLEGHNVHFTQRYNYFGVHSLLSGNPDDLKKSEYWYTIHMEAWGQQPRGIFAADERVREGKTGPRQAIETCGMIEFTKSFYLLGQISGDPMYADRCEDIMLNHFPVAHSPDYRGLHYLTASNMPQLDAGNKHDFYNQKPQLCYSPHMYRCCQHNDAMGWSWYVQNLWQATSDNGLAAWLYAPCTVKARVGDNKTVTIESVTAYPFKTNVELKITEANAARFPLYLRVPAWCQQLNVVLNNEPIDVETEPRNYVCINRTWNSGDIVQISMDNEITLTTWPNNASVTVNRGPLSYSVKIDEKWKNFNRFKMSDEWKKSAGFSTPVSVKIDIKKWPEWEVFPASPWNYGLLIDQQHPKESFTVFESDTLAENPWTVKTAPVRLTVNARRIPSWSLDKSQTVEPLPKSPVVSTEPTEQITLIPLGCARLRIGCMPVILGE